MKADAYDLKAVAEYLVSNPYTEEELGRMNEEDREGLREWDRMARRVAAWLRRAAREMKSRGC